MFENVKGIWQRKNLSYLQSIAAGLIKLGYQVRCTVLEAHDYGDPQGRPRVIMMIAKNNVPMPLFPTKTHGTGPDLSPFVTVKDALSRISSDSSLPNLEGKVSGCYLVDSLILISFNYINHLTSFLTLFHP